MRGKGAEGRRAGEGNRKERIRATKQARREEKETSEREGEDRVNKEGTGNSRGARRGASRGT